MIVWPASKGGRITVGVAGVAALTGIVFLYLASVFYLFTLVGFALIAVGCVALFKNVDARRMAVGARFEGRTTTEIPLIKSSSKSNVKARAHGKIESQPVVVILLGIGVALGGIWAGRMDSRPASPPPVLLQFPAVPRAGEVTSAPWEGAPEQEVQATVERCATDPTQAPVVLCKVRLQNNSQTDFRLLASEFSAIDDLSQSYDVAAAANVPESEWDDPKTHDYAFEPNTDRVVYLPLAGPVTPGAKTLELRFSLLKQGSSNNVVPCWVDISIAGAGLSS